MKKIEAKIIADSINPQGDRIITYLLTVPQIIVKELLRHRMFSFSSSSMRAIPFNKVLEDIRENMFVPLAFQSHHSGMQGSEYLMGEESEKAKQQWIESGLRACEEAERLYNIGVTKQLCSRIIEPFGYAKILITATEYDNFFELRCPKYHYEPENKYFRSKRDFLEYAENAFGSHIYIKDEEWRSINSSQAEIHIQALAEAMWNAMNESKPKELKAGEYHIPFGDKINDKHFTIFKSNLWKNKQAPTNGHNNLIIKIATARCARLSYMTFDNEIDYQKDIELHDRLLTAGHASPFEHVSRCLTEEEYNALGKMILDPVKGYIFEKGWVDNFKGFVSYRRILNF